MGFTLPWDVWMRGPLADTCHAGLDALTRRDILNPAAVQDLWSGFESGRVTWSRVWTLVALGQWIDRHGLE
jgi:asparagine synthase (glutamine-hydrolysing)